MNFNKFDLPGAINAMRHDLAEAGEHPAIADAERIVTAAEAFLTSLFEIRRVTHTDQADDLITGTLDGLSDVIGCAISKEEDDRVNGPFRRAIDAANARRDF